MSFKYGLRKTLNLLLDAKYQIKEIKIMNLVELVDG